MKICFISIFMFALAANISFAQSTNKNVADPVYSTVQQPPTFPGGIRPMSDFLKMNVHFPASAMRKTGKAIVTFIVEKDGSLSNLKVTKAPAPDFATEAFRLMRLMPKWIPGKVNGQPVRVNYSIAIPFDLYQ